MTSEERFSRWREKMVRQQIERRGISDKGVLKAMQAVPRHLFVPKRERRKAYQDRPLPIGERQTISQPYIVALMSQLLGLGGEEKVLEVGTGSGYQAAVLAHLASEVHSIERHASLAERARALLADLELDNVHVHVGDGSQGWPAEAPYAAIIVTAAAERMPQALLDQLEVGGHLVLPVGSSAGQSLQRWTKTEHGFDREDISPVAFVPLVVDVFDK